MKKNYIDKNIVLKELNQEDLIYDFVLLENNERQIDQIYEFLNNEEKLLTVTGFSGTGKSAVVDFVLSYLNDDVITLKYNCFETTTLDDMFLKYFEIFKNYTIQGKIHPIKTKSENFTQKISSYFNEIKNNIVVVINSFESILKDNKIQILEFIKQLLEKDNVKIIIISRTMLTKDFQEIVLSNVPILAMQQSLFEKHLRINNIKHIGVLSNELYKQTKGYYKNLRIAEHIMNLKDLTLGNFLEKYSKSLTPFVEYLHREILCYVDPVSSHLFRLLAIMRIPIHSNLIKSLNLYDEERIEFFLNHCLLDKDGECYYIKDYYRTIMENQIPENVLVKLHRACIDLYNTQLPLKPLERDLRLSRQTMRNEIEYHQLFLPKKPTATFRRVNVVSVTPPPEIVHKSETVLESVPQESKDEKIKKINFVFEDENIFDDIVQSIEGFVKETDKKNRIIHEYSSYSLTKLLNMASEEQKNKNWEEAILLYQNALTKNDDENFYTFLPTIYTKLAKIYKHLSQWYEALEYFNQAQDFYFNVENIEKVAEVKYEIAEIYYTIYKHENAKFLLSDLEKSDYISNLLKIKVNLLQAKFCDNPEQEYSYYKNSLPLIDSKIEKSIISELYYKFAGVNDERDETKLAVQYYKKCISNDSNPHTNRFLAAAYANLAEICYEANYLKPAIEYYLSSINADLSILGRYDSCARIAELYSQDNDVEEELIYLKKALNFAKQLKDDIYITEANVLLSDYYVKLKDYKTANEYCSEALKTSKTKEKTEIISAKLENISKRI